MRIYQSFSSDFLANDHELKNSNIYLQINSYLLPAHWFNNDIDTWQSINHSPTE